MSAERDWFDKDFYKTLGVSKAATEKEVTRAYRKLAKQFHPDANPGDKAAEERFKDVSAAYDVLGDPKKRKEYDELRSMARAGGSPFGGGGNPFSAGSPGTTPGGFKFDDLGDLFGGLFTRGGPNRGEPDAFGPKRGDDLEADLRLSFDDAVHGVTTSINVASDATCEACHGSGAEPGSAPVVCDECRGRGVLDDNQGVFSFSRPCPKCSGTGRRIEKPCKTCRGSGVQKRNRQVKVRIPAGVEDGQRIRLKERGGAGRNGAPAGDLYVIVHVGSHRLLKRKGKDLTITVPITFTEAALGAQVRVPTLTQPVTLKVAPGTKSGAVLRVRGRGVVKADKPGDLLVTVEIDVPKSPTDIQKRSLEAFSNAEDGAKLRSHLGV